MGKPATCDSGAELPVTSRMKPGRRGIYEDDMGLFRVTITANGKLIFVGNYYTLAGAQRAYAKAAKKYHGEFAHLNTIPC